MRFGSCCCRRQGSGNICCWRWWRDWIKRTSRSAPSTFSSATEHQTRLPSARRRLRCILRRTFTWRLWRQTDMSVCGGGATLQKPVQRDSQEKPTIAALTRVVLERSGTTATVFTVTVTGKHSQCQNFFRTRPAAVHTVNTFLFYRKIKIDIKNSRVTIKLSKQKFKC